MPLKTKKKVTASNDRAAKRMKNGGEANETSSAESQPPLEPSTVKKRYKQE